VALLLLLLADFVRAVGGGSWGGGVVGGWVDLVCSHNACPSSWLLHFYVRLSVAALSATFRV